MGVRRGNLLFLVCLLLIFWGLVSRASSYTPWVTVPIGGVDVSVCVVALEGVGGHAVGSVSRMVEGVLSACEVNTTKYITGLLDYNYKPYPEYHGLGINTSVHVIKDWAEYREIVESDLNVIFVNAHGETVPVPSGYSKESWADEIAEAMAYRNSTWVHTSGYPFYYYWSEGAKNETLWNVNGFQRLMSHMNLGHVTCSPPDYEARQIEMEWDARDTLGDSWFKILNAFYAERGKPLKASDFREYLVMSIWGVPYGYYTGAIIKFSYPNSNGYGFYVHIGTYQTFTGGHEQTDADFLKGYAGAAAAINTVALRLTSEKAILNAERAVVDAETQGRTKGLGEAKQIVKEAKSYYSSRKYYLAVEAALVAQEKASQATQLSFLEAYGLVTLGIVGTIAVGALIIIWRRKFTNSSKKRNEDK